MFRSESKLPETHRPELAHRCRPLVLGRAAAALAAVALATPALANDVLIYDDNTKSQVAQTACANLGYTCTRAVSGDFETQLAGAEWDLVVMDLPSNEPTGDWQGALAAHILAGGAAIHSHWNAGTANAVADAFEVTIGGSHPTLDFHRWNDHAVFDHPNDVPNVFDEWTDQWGTNGFFLSIAPASGAEAAAGFTPDVQAAQAAMVIGNDGATIFNGFLFDDYAGVDKDGDQKDDIVELVENQMQLVLGGGTPPPPPPGACPAAPEPTCLSMNKGKLTVQEGRAGYEKLVAKMQKGAELTQTDLGNPTVADGTSYHLCIYDGANDLVTEIEVDRAAETCGRRGCWGTIGAAAPNGTGYHYRDGAGDADGVTQMKLKGGKASQSLVKIVAKNNARRDRLGLRTGITAGLVGSESATLQLHGSDAAVCLSLELSKVKVANDERFQAR